MPIPNHPYFMPPRGALPTDGIQNSTSQGEPGELQEFVLGSSGVDHFSLPQDPGCVGRVGTPGFQQVRHKRGDVIA
jgi:hypothetical protein